MRQGRVIVTSKKEILVEWRNYNIMLKGGELEGTTLHEYPSRKARIGVGAKGRQPCDKEVTAVTILAQRDGVLIVQPIFDD